MSWVGLPTVSVLATPLPLEVVGPLCTSSAVLLLA